MVVLSLKQSEAFAVGVALTRDLNVDNQMQYIYMDILTKIIKILPHPRKRKQLKGLFNKYVQKFQLSLPKYTQKGVPI